MELCEQEFCAVKTVVSKGKVVKRPGRRADGHPWEAFASGVTALEVANGIVQVTRFFERYRKNKPLTLTGVHRPPSESGLVRQNDFYSVGWERLTPGTDGRTQRVRQRPHLPGMTRIDCRWIDTIVSSPSQGGWAEVEVGFEPSG